MSTEELISYGYFDNLKQNWKLFIFKFVVIQKKWNSIYFCRKVGHFLFQNELKSCQIGLPKNKLTFFKNDYCFKFLSQTYIDEVIKFGFIKQDIHL